MVAEPPDPFEGRELDVAIAPPQTVEINDLSLAKADHALHEGDGFAKVAPKHRGPVGASVHGSPWAGIWSPLRVVNRLPIDSPGDPSMRI